MKKPSNQQGFTLIELIVVIVILGILAVSAAPKFMSFTSDARGATVEGLKGSLKTAMQLTYGKSVVGGTETAATGTADTIATVYGYPAATKAALDAAAGVTSATDGSSEYTVIVNTTPTPNIVYYYPSSLYNATTPLTASTVEAGNCYVKYTAAANATTAAITTAVITGCDS